MSAAHPAPKHPFLHATVAGRLFAVRWQGAPTLESLAHLQREVARAARAEPNLAYVGFSSDEIGTPDAAMQSAWTRNAVVLLGQVSSFDLVLESGGIQGAMTRTFFRGMLTAARLGSRVAGHDLGGVPLQKIAIFDSAARFAEGAGPRLGLAPASLLEQLRREGLLVS